MKGSEGGREWVGWSGREREIGEEERAIEGGSGRKG